jgi:chemotaxis protein methyltransferase CheR
VAEPAIDRNDLDFVRSFVRARSGIALTDDKAYLLESRLAPLARRLGYADTSTLLRNVRLSPTEGLLTDITEALTTNETSFFRDGHPFDEIKERILPKLAAARSRGRSLRIWSAACASGQEAYSLAICIEELAHLFDRWTVEILATDIAERPLERVRAGLYSDFEVRRGLDPARLKRWFEPEGGNWSVRPQLKGRVRARRHNLLQRDLSLGTFDLVLLRNVLIYFDVPTKRQVLESIRAHLADDGFLLLGGTETILGVSDALGAVSGSRGLFRPIHPRGASTPTALSLERRGAAAPAGLGDPFC